MAVTYKSVDDFLDQHGTRNKRTLVVGSRVYGSKPDRRQLYTKAFGLDMLAGEGVDLIHDLNHPLPEAYGKFDHIDLVSVLEHCDKPWLVAENIANCVNENATILISAPFVWRVHAYPGDYFRYSVQAYESLFPTVEWVEKGYLVGDKLKKLVGGINQDGKTYMERSEAIGFGLFIS